MYNVHSGIAAKYIPRCIKSSKPKALHSTASLSLSLLCGICSGNTWSNSFNRVGNDRSHSREKKDFLNVRAVSEEHDKSVDTETPATGRRETVLKATQILATIHIWTKRWNSRVKESLVNTLCLLVTLLLLLDLFHEPLPLIEGVVQLCVGIANLLGT